MDTIEIEIDGQQLTAKPNQTVIEVADKAGIYIPRFCYHKHLSVAANCRMCLVEVEKSPKTLPACATPVAPGMKVWTKSPKTIEAQRAVMEFLLINHPLDCPICDQGGECELQDVSMGYGSSWSHYDESKRSVADENLGPLIETEMTRCIQCTRCVRFGDEIAGLPELGLTNRGEHVEISTYIEKTMHSDVSGNIIDLCPVGALTSKPYRFTARAWELDQAPSISPHDCIGANLNVHTRYGTVMRVVAKENQAVNETWIADRDRFSYTSLYHADRVREPRIRKQGHWHTVSWQEAFEVATEKLQNVLNENGPEQIGALASPHSTLEEFYLLQKIMRGLGSSNVDHRLREVDTRDQASQSLAPGFGMTMAELETCDAILLIGSHLPKEQPLAALRVRKAIKNHNAVVTAINPVDFPFNFDVVAKEIVAPHVLVQTLANAVTALEKKQDHWIGQYFNDKKKIAIILGAFVQHHSDAAILRSLAHRLAELSGGHIVMMTDGANGAGGWLAGAVPHRQAGGKTEENAGLSAYEMLMKPRQAYLLLNVEPDLDCANTAYAIQAMQQAQCVIALSTFDNPILEQHADVILPVAPFTETSGTFVNGAGEWQAFTGVAKAFANSRPAWKVLRVLGNFLHLKNFDYESSQEVSEEVKSLLEMSYTPPARELMDIGFLSKDKITMSRIGEIPIYSVDGLVRRAEPLQTTQALVEGNQAVVKLHPDFAKERHLAEGELVKVRQENEVVLPVKYDRRIPLHAVYIASGIQATAGLGDLLGPVEIHKV